MALLDWRTDEETPSQRLQRLLRNRKVVAIVAAVIGLYALITVVWTFGLAEEKRPEVKGEKVVQTNPHVFMDGTSYAKPAEQKVVGLVFYGRWSRVQILDCYLKQNLVVNGGFLDEVLFVVNTADKGDLEKLETILASQPQGYRKGLHVSHEDGNKMDFTRAWDNLASDDTLYIKMDDDVVYMHPDAIPRMVQYRLENPDPYMISANVINNPKPSWVHWNLGVIHGFLPEGIPPRNWDNKARVDDWRVSGLPKIKHSFFPDKDYDDPSHPHRWLPVDGDSSNADHTPIWITEYKSFGKGWRDWRVAAQEHMSFLLNLELGESALKKYMFKEWDAQYGRISINMVAIFARDLQKAFPMPKDDEEQLSATIPAKLKRHVKFVGEALVVHYSFNVQRKGLDQTDILERYRALGRETCGGKLLGE